MTACAALLTLLLAGAPKAAATEIGYGRDLGLGLTLGEPSGLSGKYYFLGPSHAVEAAVAADIWGVADGRITAYATYLFHPGLISAGQLFAVPWHLGGGVQAWTNELGDDDPDDDLDGDGAFGFRIPIGLDLNFQELPLQISGDLAAALPIAPELEIGLDVHVAVRYYF